MTFQELMDKITRILPDATFDEDLDGQVIIYTDLSEKQDGQLEPFDPMEED